MKEIVARSILSAKNNMNIYRGCTHGCIYCDSRSKCYGMTYTFEDIEVKVNAVSLLEQTLAKKKSKCMITTGAMTDPYIPLEATLQNTRKCLEVIEKYGFGACLLTKSDLILRDIDLLKRINEKTKCIVQMTLTTYDETLCKIVEPNVCTTKRRFEALCELRDSGIETIVWMNPILPFTFINDTKENIEGLLSYCKEAEVKGILTFGIGMTLRYGNREYYYKKLDEHFPGLKREYMQKFGSSYGIKSPYNTQLTKLVKGFCKENSMLYGEKEIFEYCLKFPEQDKQLTLWSEEKNGF